MERFAVAIALLKQTISAFQDFRAMKRKSLIKAANKRNAFGINSNAVGGSGMVGGGRYDNITDVEGAVGTSAPAPTAERAADPQELAEMGAKDLYEAPEFDTKMLDSKMGAGVDSKMDAGLDSLFE